MSISVHENLFLKLTALMVDQGLDVLTLGDKMTELGADTFTKGGFWIIDFKTNIEYYSPNFRASLGYEGEHDFPSTRDSWRNLLSKDELALTDKNLELYLETNGEHPYCQVVSYPTKTGDHLKVMCSGTVTYDSKGNPNKMFGTHKILS